MTILPATGGINRALGLAALCLAAIVALELLPGGSAPVRAVSVVPPPTGPKQADAIDPRAWAATSLARPIFNPDRRPAAPPEAPPAPDTPVGIPRLSGIMMTASGGVAIFAGDKSTSVAKGGKFGAFTVSDIRPGAVTIEGPSGRQVLSPKFDPSTRIADATPPPAAPGFAPPFPAPGAQPAAPGQLGFQAPGIRPIPGIPTIPGLPQRPQR